MGWIGNYGHLAYEKQQVLLWELGQIDDLRRHFLKLIKLPGQHNRAIGEAFVNLIDEAFRNYSQWQLSLDAVSYNDWALQFKSQVELKLNRWLEH